MPRSASAATFGCAGSGLGFPDFESRVASPGTMMLDGKFQPPATGLLQDHAAPHGLPSAERRDLAYDLLHAVARQDARRGMERAGGARTHVSQEEVGCGTRRKTQPRHGCRRRLR